jgi:hypothetical protein
MTLGQQIESEAFDAMLGIQGETLTVKRGLVDQFDVQAIVRRPQLPNNENALARYGGASNGALDFTMRDHSKIVIRAAALDPAPKVGESFVDSENRVHRVQQIFPIPGFLKLICKVA